MLEPQGFFCAVLDVNRTRWILREAPLQQLQITRSGCVFARLWRPRTGRILRTTPLDNVRVAMRSCVIAGCCGPGARRVLCAQPLQNIQSAAACCAECCPIVPRAGWICSTTPLQQLKVSVCGCFEAGPRIPGARTIISNVVRIVFLIVETSTAIIIILGVVFFFFLLTVVFFIVAVAVAATVGDTFVIASTATTTTTTLTMAMLSVVAVVFVGDNNDVVAMMIQAWAPAPLQNVQMSSVCSRATRVAVPGTARLLGAAPFQHGQVPSQSRISACFGAPRARRLRSDSTPFQNIQMPATRGKRARKMITRRMRRRYCLYVIATPVYYFCVAQSNCKQKNPYAV